MKKYSGRRAEAAAFLIPLLFCLLSSFASAQTHTEERVETGRFGTEEPELPQRAAEEKGLDAQWLYLGVRTGPSLRFYTPSGAVPYTGGDTSGLSLDAALQLNLRVLSFLSIQGEAVFTWDMASLWAYRRSNGEIDRYTIDFSSLSMQFPVLIRLDFYPGRFRVSPFFGPYFSVPLGNMTVTNLPDDREQSYSYAFSPPLGLLGGLNGAIQFGPGAIFADLRYAADLGEPEAEGGSMPTYRRTMVSLTLGYELGFFNRKRGNTP
jgi:hypothetical protein